MYKKIFAVTILAANAQASEQAPTIDPANDEQHFGSMDQVLFWEPHQQVSGFRNMEKIAPARLVKSSGAASPMPTNLRDLGGVEFAVDDIVISVDEYFTTRSVAGLLVLKNGEVVYERYGLGNTADSRWVSFSVAKSVVAALYGAAVKDGYIDSLDDKVTDYLPQLKDSSYQDVTIRNLLQMASGVEWDETYSDPEADINQATWETLNLYEYLRHKPRAAPPGELFNYNTAETNLAGTLLRSAIGNNLSTYLEEKVWKPFGMQSDAYWMLTEPGGGEFGGCCILATLRDYARIGQFALAGGVVANGESVLVDGWMQESTAPSKGYEGYGYFWWLSRGGVYEASGIFGQGIYIDPSRKVIIAIHSARPHASRPEDWALHDAMYPAIARALD